MRILNQIIFIFFVIALVFLIKSDYKSVPSTVLSYLQSEVGRSSSLYKDKVGNVIDNIKNNNPNDNDDNTSEESNLIKKVETPGALTVSDNYLTNNTKNIKLSIKGVIDITNQYRSENGGLVALKENSKLDFSAEKKLQDMFVKGYFEHVSPDGVGVGDLGNQVSYEYIIIGENLALGNFKDYKALVDAWMASTGHRANILNKRYTEIGVAVGSGTYQGKNVWMAVQHFALPKSACPSIDGVLKGIIDLDQKNIKSTESDLSVKRARIESGAIYEGMTTSDQINAYNSLVNDYNKMIVSIKEKIYKYNEQVKAFNLCISQTD